MSNIRWFMLGYGTYKLEHIIAENLVLSHRHSLIEALQLVKEIKKTVENGGVPIDEVLTMWNRAYDLYKDNSDSDDANDSM
jgi:hypothetical protein